MTNEISGSPRPEDSPGLQVVDVGGSTVSMQVLQSIYNEMTGKVEELEKVYDRSFQITFPELEQLYAKLEQLCEQYHIEQSSCHVVVYHAKGAKETFSSFERFRTYNQSRLDPVERIRLKYSFLIVLPKLKKPQSYELTLQLVSGVTAFKGMRDQLPPQMLAVLSQASAHVSVEYVDYLVARNIMDTVDEWLEGVPYDPGSRTAKYLQRKADRIPESLGVVSVGFLAIILCLLVPTYIEPASPDFQVLARFVILSGAGGYILLRAVRLLGRRLSGWIVAIDQIGYIKLNKGDEKAITETKKTNRSKWIKTVAASLLALLTGLVSSLIANWLSSS